MKRLDLEQEWLCKTPEVDEEAVESIKKDMLSEDTIISLSEVFKALGDPTRLNIIYLLSKHNLCVYDIAAILNMSQSAISHQLRVLRGLRLVKFKKEGKHAIYSLDDEHVVQLFNQGLEHISHN
ncbi:MAG: ArsR family transcriptional regulator [Gottschalkiaceae bacterium]|nr:MAG: ArsR family transcriptional regulator [Gottschalkiaceae bacterium]